MDETKAPARSGAADYGETLGHIYDIGLDPARLEDFIDHWLNADVASGLAGAGGAAFGETFQTHLDRVANFLFQGETASAAPADLLRPYDAFAAIALDGALRVTAANSGARAAFGINAGDALARLDLGDEDHTALSTLARTVLAGRSGGEGLIRIGLETGQGAMLFRVLRADAAGDGAPAAILVSTHIHWRTSVGATLREAFGLTPAEQGVVRKLMEGRDARGIAAERGTAIGTVRSQIKSITGKMGVRGQAEIIRFAIILGEFSGKGPNVAAPPVPSAGWLEAETWKAFGELRRPGGRTLTYHDMGPPGGAPILTSHMGSCMVRWTAPMVRLLFERNLRVICPVRAGYGRSGDLPPGADVLAEASDDAAALLAHLGIERLPYAVHGSDFPLVASLASRRPGLITEVVGIGARPCLPGGQPIEGTGRWQRFFVWAARHDARLALFASRAVMSLTRRIGPDAMLERLCRDSPADLDLLRGDDVRAVLSANLGLMAGRETDAARAFASEYIAFHSDWSPMIGALSGLRTHLFIATEDPTIDLDALPELEAAYPWMTSQVVPDAGLALLYRKPALIVEALSDAAARTRDG